ncbi:MAG: hypothetical protein FJ316_08810 [SAR202 cluster bacterium]|nr:hypothetical protein [SAR202 cluster bacterium]
MTTGAQPMAAGTPMIQRMIGAAKLNVHTFEEVEADPKANSQAMMVVIMVSIASAIGAVLATAFGGVGGAGEAEKLGWLVKDVAFGVVRGIVWWAFWALLTFILGTSVFKTQGTHANWSQLARTTGFAQSPGVFQILFFIPVIGPLIAIITLLWQAAAMVIAVRQALDYTSTLRAVGVVVVVFLIGIFPLYLIASALGIAGMSR